MIICRELKCYQTAGKVANDAVSGTKGLNAISEILRKNVPRIYNTKLDVEGFYTNDAIDSLQRNGLVNSEEEAVSIGMALEKVGYIQNAKTDETFSDARLFFRFALPRSKKWEDELDDIASLLYTKLEPKDHFYHRRKYKGMFFFSFSKNFKLFIAF